MPLICGYLLFSSSCKIPFLNFSNSTFTYSIGRNSPNMEVQQFYRKHSDKVLLSKSCSDIILIRREKIVTNNIK